MAIQYDCYPHEIKKKLGDKLEEFIKTLPNFSTEYQSWYSEA